MFEKYELTFCAIVTIAALSATFKATKNFGFKVFLLKFFKFYFHSLKFFRKQSKTELGQPFDWRNICRRHVLASDLFFDPVKEESDLRVDSGGAGDSAARES